MDSHTARQDELKQLPKISDSTKHAVESSVDWEGDKFIISQPDDDDIGELMKQWRAANPHASVSDLFAIDDNLSVRLREFMQNFHALVNGVVPDHPLTAPIGVNKPRIKIVKGGKRWQISKTK